MKHNNHSAHNHKGHDGVPHNHQGKEKHDHGHGHSHHDHHKMMIEYFKKRVWVSSLLTVPVLLLSPMIQSWMGVNWTFNGDNYILFALASIIFFYGGLPFLKGLVEELKKKTPGMMTLIAIAISAAYFYSVAAVSYTHLTLPTISSV